MSSTVMIWKKPITPTNAVAIPDTMIAWLSQQSDLNRVKVINRIFDRLVISSTRYSAYRMLISDQDLLIRTKQPQYNAPLNLIRRSLSTNLMIAVCALHDKSSGSFSIERFIDRMVKDRFHLRAIDYHSSRNENYDAAVDSENLICKREQFKLPRWKEDFKILQTLRHEELAHFSLNATDLPSYNIDDILKRTYEYSLDMMFATRRLFVGSYQDADFEAWFGNRAQWQARHLVSMIHPPTVLGSGKP